MGRDNFIYYTADIARENEMCKKEKVDQVNYVEN